ncbi:MAG: flavin reductase family protein [Gemmatimonadota bacterium]
MPDDGFGALTSSLDPPLIVVTTAAGGERAGCLVGFHCQASIEPLRYCVWLSKANHTYRVALRATHLALHFLPASGLPLAERFGTLTGDRTDKFAGLGTGTGPGGVPLLADCPHWLAARRTTLVDEGGDHVCVMTEPVSVHAGHAFTPLRLSQAAHLEPGHGNEERPAPPTERATP